MRDVIRRYPWLFEVLVFMLGLGAFLKWVNAPGDPVEILNYTVLSQAVHAGGEMQVEFLLNRKRSCQVSTIRRWEDVSGKEIARLPARPALSTTLGISRITVTIPVPPRTGRLCYASEVHYRCDDGRHTVATPDICVDVLPALAASEPRT